MKDHLYYSQLCSKLHTLDHDPLYLNHPLRKTNFKEVQPEILKFLIFQKYFKKIQNGEWTHVVSWHGLSLNYPIGLLDKLDITYKCIAWHLYYLYAICAIISAFKLMLPYCGKWDLSETLQIDDLNHFDTVCQ